MTEIDRRSWHYRWAIWSHLTEPQDLCTYVRSVVVTGVVSVALCGCLGVAVAILLFVSLLLIENIVQHPLIALFVLLVVLLLAVVVAVGAPSKGIYAAHRRAKRLGICPFIEYH